MGTNNFPPSADEIIRDLQQRITRLEAAAQNRVPLDTITGGNLQVQDAAGNTYAFIGEYGNAYPDGSPQYGFFLARQTGEQQVGGPVMALFNGAPGSGGAQTMNLYDASGNLIYGDDGLSSYGLARPFIPFPMMRSDLANWPSTTSGSFVDVFFSFPPVQSPKVYFQGYMSAPTGTNAQIQAVSGSTVLGQTGTLIGSTTGLTFWSLGPIEFPQAVGAAYATPTDLRIQASRTAGSGTVQVAVGASYGCQS